jgi:hypothetical protein
VSTESFSGCLQLNWVNSETKRLLASKYVNKARKEFAELSKSKVLVSKFTDQNNEQFNLKKLKFTPFGLLQNGSVKGLAINLAQP